MQEKTCADKGVQTSHKSRASHRETHVVLCSGRPESYGIFSVRQGVKVPLSAINPFRTAVTLWGQLRASYLEFEWFVPKTGLRF